MPIITIGVGFPAYSRHKTRGWIGEDDGVSAWRADACFWSISPPEGLSYDQPAEATIPDGKLCWADEIGIMMGEVDGVCGSDEDDADEWLLSNS